MHNTLHKIIVALPLISLLSCGVLNDNVVLFEAPDNLKLGFEPTDTIIVKTPFYFGVISPKGYDRFEGNVFENLRFESMAILSQEHFDKELLIYRRILRRKPFKLEYELQTIVGQKRQTVLDQIHTNGNIALEILTDSIFIEKKIILETPTISSSKEPLPVGTETLVLAKMKRELGTFGSSERVLIISCISKDRFSEEMLDQFKKVSPVTVNYYYTDTWVRIFVRDETNGGISLEDAQRLFPGSWPSYYGK